MFGSVVTLWLVARLVLGWAGCMHTRRSEIIALQLFIPPLERAKRSKQSSNAFISLGWCRLALRPLE